MRQRKRIPHKRLVGSGRKTGARAVWNLRNEGREWPAVSSAPKRQRMERIEKCLDLVTRKIFMALGGRGEEPVCSEFKREEAVRKG